MALDRGVLARIDRAVLAELDHGKGTQLVKVPVSDAVWSTWRRYCDVVDVSMGGAIAMLVEHELSSVDDPGIDGALALVERLRVDLAKREHEVAQRELEVDSELRRLRGLEVELRARAALQPSPTAMASAKPGRNEPCACGSGRKYKVCHGST